MILTDIHAHWSAQLFALGQPTLHKLALSRINTHASISLILPLPPASQSSTQQQLALRNPYEAGRVHVRRHQLLPLTNNIEHNSSSGVFSASKSGLRWMASSSPRGENNTLLLFPPFPLKFSGHFTSSEPTLLRMHF